MREGPSLKQVERVEVPAKARRRGMRGLVRRVLAGCTVENRQLYTYGFPFPERRFRICTWCHEPVDEPRKRYWHSHCQLWRAVSTGRSGAVPCGSGTASGRRAVEQFGTREWATYYRHWHRRSCAECGRRKADHWRTLRLDIDHKLPIAVAVELGRKGIMRAFLPENLQYLCSEPCHRQKTARDATMLKIMRRGLFAPEPKHMEAVGSSAHAGSFCSPGYESA